MKSVTLPELPKDLSPEIKEQKYVKYEIEKPELHPVEKVGDRLMKYQKCSENGFEKYYEIESKNEIEECEEDSDYEEESPELLKLNPYNWKSQDHYAVLGLSKLRINATDEDIKNAYRKKVLRHHPDKKASDGNSNNDSFFKCIQKAYEIITDPVKRRQFDSVDPEFDESIPTKCSKEDFFEVLTPVFERNARFSNIQPVPSLGDMNSTREEVEEFYRFWSEFDSWRSFEYLDEEDVDSYDNREDKRYFERKNKNARAKHKKEDNQRIINLIDLAVRTDPRLALYRKADREAKEAKRLEKKAAQIAAANEEKKRKEEEEKAKERALKEEQEKIAREKKEKEMKKRIIRKEKKTLKKFLQENNYLIDPSTPASPEQIESQLKKLDGYIVQMDSDNLTAYRVYLLRAFENGWESASKYFDEDHLNEGEKYSAELAAMAPVEEVKEEVKEVKDSDVEPIVEEKKEEVEKVEVIEENKEPEVKPAVARMLKKLPSISRIGGMRRTRKKVIRKEYDSSSEDERELEKEKEKEKEEAAPETASKKKNKKKKKSKKKNSSEELKVNVEEEPTTEAVKEEVATPAEEPTTEKVKEEVVVPAEEPVVEEVKEEIVVPAEEPVVEEVKEEVDTSAAEEPVIVEEVKEEVVVPAEESVVEEVKEEIVVPAEEPVVEEVKELVIEEVKEEAPVEAKPEIKSSKKIKKKKSRAKIDAKPKEEKKEEKKEIKNEPKKPEVPVKSKVDILKEVKKQEEENAKRIKDILKKKVSMGKLRTKKSSKKLREEKREKEKEEEEKKEELTITIKDDNKKKTKAERKVEKAAKKLAKQAEAEAKDEAKTETEATKEAPVEEQAVVEEAKGEAKEEVAAPAIEDSVVEEVKEEVAVPAAEKPVVEEVKEEVAIPSTEEIHEVHGMYEVKPVYGTVPEIDTKTKMYTVKSIYGDNVIVDLPLTASQHLNDIEENIEPATEEKTEIEEVEEEKIEVINEVSEDKTEVEEKTEIIEETSEIEEKTEIVEDSAATEVEEKIEVETIPINEPAKKEDNTEKTAKTLKHCPSGISLKSWTPEQQTKLEEALQKFPSIQFKENPMDRWIAISNYVGRSRTDIKFRIKDLAEAIRRKRSIQSLKGEN